MSSSVDGAKEGAPARSVARLAVVQALYQMEAAGLGVEAIIKEFEEFRLGGFLDGEKLNKADATFFASILRGTIESQKRIDPYLERRLAAGWKLSRIDSIARAILRAALYELISRPDVPYKVVINEYVEIAKTFFEGDEPNFINGVLDAAAQDARGDD